MDPETTLLSTEVTIPSDVLYEVLEDEVVLLNLTSESYYILDDVGTRMWQLLIEQKHPELVVRQILNEYDTDEKTVRNDLSILIGQLLDKKLLSHT